MPTLEQRALSIEGDMRRNLDSWSEVTPNLRDVSQKAAQWGHELGQLATVGDASRFVPVLTHLGKAENVLPNLDAAAPFLAQTYRSMRLALDLEVPPAAGKITAVGASPIFPGLEQARAVKAASAKKKVIC
jgi:hypothetical protein